MGSPCYPPWRLPGMAAQQRLLCQSRPPLPGQANPGGAADSGRVLSSKGW